VAVTADPYRCVYDEHPKHPEAAVMATVLQAYQFALDPTPRQQGSLASHAGAAQFAYNWGLELVTIRLDQRKTDPSVQVPWTLPELRREWNRAKHDVAPWWAENSKEAYNSGLDGLARALKNWSDSRIGLRRGRPVGFPHRKRKRRARVACRFTTGAIRVLPDRKHVQLPRIGVVKTHCDDPAGGCGECLTRRPTGLMPGTRTVGSSRGHLLLVWRSWPGSDPWPHRPGAWFKTCRLAAAAATSSTDRAV